MRYLSVRALRLYGRLIPLALVAAEAFLCGCVYSIVWWQAKHANDWACSVHRRAREARAKIAA